MGTQLDILVAVEVSLPVLESVSYSLKLLLLATATRC